MLAYQKLGYKKLVVKALVSKETCDFCLYMDGRIISIEELTRKLKGLQTAVSIEETKRFHRWAADIKNYRGMNTTELAKEGVSFPPYHPRCYCQLVAYIEDRYEPIEIVYGEDAKNDEYLEGFIGSYSKHELSVKVHEVMARAKAQVIPWNEKDQGK